MELPPLSQPNVVELFTAKLEEEKAKVREKFEAQRLKLKLEYETFLKQYEEQEKQCLQNVDDYFRKLISPPPPGKKQEEKKQDSSWWRSVFG